MSERQIEKLTSKFHCVSLGSTSREDFIQKLAAQYPNGFSLRELVYNGTISMMAIHATSLISMLYRVKARRDEVQTCDDGDDRCNADWEEPLLCEFYSLVDSANLPPYQTTPVEALFQAYIDGKALVSGSLFTDDKWTINNAERQEMLYY